MHDILDVLDGDLKDRVRDCKLPEEKLRLEKAIGSGSFGMVYRGQLEKEKGCIMVAVKTLKGKLLLNSLLTLAIHLTLEMRYLCKKFCIVE